VDGVRHDLGVEDLLDRQLGTELRGRVVLGVPLVLHADESDLIILDTVDRHVAMLLQREDPEQVRSERPLRRVVENRDERPLRMRLAGGHLLLADHECRAELPAGEVHPAVDRCEDARAAAHIAARVGLAPGTTSGGQILRLHVHAVECVWRGAVDDAVDVIERHSRAFERLAGRGPGELGRGLLRTPNELRDAGTDDGDSLTHGSPKE
jgi:hypothetical protein